LKSLMLNHAFGFVDRVVFIVGENNLRSQKAVERIGGEFLKEADRPGRDGVVRRNLLYAITRDEFHKTADAARAQ